MEKIRSTTTLSDGRQIPNNILDQSEILKEDLENSQFEILNDSVFESVKNKRGIKKSRGSSGNMDNSKSKGSSIHSSKVSKPSEKVAPKVTPRHI